MRRAAVCNGSIDVAHGRSKEAISEALAVVHRKIGTSKRFSEADKRDVAEILATGLFESRERGHRQGEIVKQELELNETVYKAKMRSWLAVVSEVMQFAREHVSQLDTHAHDLTTTTDLLARLGASSEKRSVFVDSMQTLLERISRMINHNEALSYEREKCLRLLGVVEPDKNVSRVLGYPRRKLGRNSAFDLCRLVDRHGKFYQFAGWLDTIEDKDGRINALTREFDELSTVVTELREETELLRQELNDIDEELKELELNGTGGYMRGVDLDTE